MKYSLIFLITLIMPLFYYGPARATSFVETPDVTVLYEEGSREVASDIAASVSVLRREIAAELGWGYELVPVPRIVLMNESRFRENARTDTIIAYAISRGNIIALDLFRVERSRSTLREILRHELIHLYLSDNIKPSALPRWFNEGVAGWLSNGASEFYRLGRPSVLSSAAMNGRLMSLRELERFPADEKPMELAYQQSRSFIEYLATEYGRGSVHNVLGLMKSGDGLYGAFKKTYGMPLAQLEREWAEDLRTRNTWVIWVSSNLITLLFVFAGAVTFFGYLMMLKRKRDYRLREEEEEGVFDDPGEVHYWEEED